MDKKVKIMKMICVELSIDTKKQLYVQENELFELIKVLNFSNGVTIAVQCRTKKIIDYAISHQQRFLELCETVKVTLYTNKS
ncbi:MAG: hypothetical protein ACRBHB_09615 [Arenicella sp.]